MYLIRTVHNLTQEYHITGKSIYYTKSRKPVSENSFIKTKEIVEKQVLLQFCISNSTYTVESLDDRSSLSG